MEQTAVEFISKGLFDILQEAENNNILEIGTQNFKWYIEMFEKQAKEMEKKRMIEFTNDYVLTQCNASFEGNVSAELSAEEYYELTFKSE